MAVAAAVSRVLRAALTSNRRAKSVEVFSA
jgi:hypothetical protein